MGKNFELLSSDKHKKQLSKYGRDVGTARPDITHQVNYLLLICEHQCVVHCYSLIVSDDAIRQST